MSSLLIRNISRLWQTDADNSRQIVKGADMATVPSLENAWLLIEGDRIHSFGLEADPDAPTNAAQVIDATGKMVLPAWCDSHTHIVYAGSRESEFVDRIKGLSYEEIARRGGGILNSALKLRETSEEELLEHAWRRMGEIQDFGTGAVEIKSGYGLDLESELKILRVARKLASISDLTVKTTFLGAHAVPPEFKGNADGYVELLCKTMVPKVVDEGLADYIDVFCDRGFFTPEHTDRILEAGARHGLKAKIHANELDYSGGIQAGVRNNAISVDHLEYTGTKEIACLLDSETMPTLLPSTAFFLNLPYAPARNMIDAGLPVALATDYNPGSTPSGRMAFVLSLACIKMNMTPEEALNAATINGAKAMEVHYDHGRIALGAMANVIITKAIPSLAYIPYSFGSDLVESVIIKGSLR